MLSCWSGDPTERPTFSGLVGTLSQKLSSMACYMDLNTISTLGTWEDNETSENAEAVADVHAACDDENNPLTTPGVSTSADPNSGVGEEVAA